MQPVGFCLMPMPVINFAYFMLVLDNMRKTDVAMSKCKKINGNSLWKTLPPSHNTTPCYDFLFIHDDLGSVCTCANFSIICTNFTESLLHYIRAVCIILYMKCDASILTLEKFLKLFNTQQHQTQLAL